MKYTKKIRLAALTLALVLALGAVLTACGEEKKEVIGLMIAYMGPSITTTEHEFTPEEFYVIATYADGSQETLSGGYTVTYDHMEAGYFVLKVSYMGYEDLTGVLCEIPIYPSDKK